ncbi:unnamed protein product [Nesidiocoris tenuis]|uniref:Uncharacterized protein n=1 Tax=Nesidiocoris tenuis TaxID=355587 RepID=A0A6H5H6D3_9HEMI|nr:unnamed protein product [Nesidiocoris tenuis]
MFDSSGALLCMKHVIVMKGVFGSTGLVQKSATRPTIDQWLLREATVRFGLRRFYFPYSTVRLTLTAPKQVVDMTRTSALIEAW